MISVMEKFERLLRGVVLHKVFVGSYLLSGVVAIALLAAFSSSRSYEDLILGVTLGVVSGYFALIAILCATQTYMEFLSRDTVSGAVKLFVALLMFFLTFATALGAYHILREL